MSISKHSDKIAVAFEPMPKVPAVLLSSSSE
jgi:hypothetical protein